MTSLKSSILALSLLATPFIGQAGQPTPPVAALTGFPSPEREWQGKEYAAALDLIASGRATLPHLADAETAPIFERLTDEHNFSFHRNHSVPALTRVRDLMQLQESWNALFNRYVKEAVQGNPVHVELARGQAFDLRILAVQVAVINDLILTFPKDAKYATRVENFNSTYTGMAKALDLAQRSLAEDFYSPGDRSVLLQALRDALPGIKPRLPDAFRAELLHRFETYQLPKRGDDERNLALIVDTLRT